MFLAVGMEAGQIDYNSYDDLNVSVEELETMRWIEDNLQRWVDAIEEAITA